ncbi:MAG TPA: alpha/beta fold hydrolase, partial [Anaerolineales bacterium]|nr:alpha/beta fold hydrolase [Anaerolineales bacterium]
VMDRLNEIKVPCLVMAGREDFLFPPEHQAILADRLPDARLELIERAGHNPQIERTAEVLAAIRSFLAGASARDEARLRDALPVPARTIDLAEGA